ncbi:DegV family protein [Butyrivibrio fibrisolvens]|uniref:DegV family protein n=1 Tax=Butyrivibrio fibrisolvens TaxID=831 RepID=UPI0003B7093D|nr:DegV family protein [Butyrivibrio fibrisolvens]
MESGYVISCCSTVDLPKDFFEKKNIRYICFHYQLDGVDYLDDLGQTIPLDEFYKKMEDGADTKTSQINVEEYEEYFESIVKEGKDIIHLTLSSGISGTINSANIAKDMVLDKYPDRKIEIIDSLAASSGYGLLMDILADKRDQGLSFEDLKEFALDIRNKVQHWFFSTDLTFYIKGGRVSKTAGFVGSMLNICPLLNVNIEGKLIPREKVRTKKKVSQRVVDIMEERALGGKDYSGKCFISQSACREDAEYVASLIEARFPKLKGKVMINDIGTTIGSHTGPGTVAVFFIGDQKDD